MRKTVREVKVFSSKHLDVYLCIRIADQPPTSYIDVYIKEVKKGKVEERRTIHIHPDDFLKFARIVKNLVSRRKKKRKIIITRERPIIIWYKANIKISWIYGERQVSS